MNVVDKAHLATKYLRLGTRLLSVLCLSSQDHVSKTQLVARMLELEIIDVGIYPQLSHISVFDILKFECHYGIIQLGN